METEKFIFKDIKITPNPANTNEIVLISVEIEYIEGDYPLGYPHDYAK
jgi:hypothetical protein